MDQFLDFLKLSFAMIWEILWALILGFALSGVVQGVVSKSEMSKLLPDDSPKSIAISCGLGAASSSCSYAAVALARSIFRKGANFTAAITFEFASTNLVIELGIIMAVLLGWQFTAAEFIGGPIMVVVLVILFRLFLTPALVRAAREQADKGLRGVMEGHTEMDMSVKGGSLWSRIASPSGFTSISHYFLMDWASVYKDVFGGLLLAGALGTFVPDGFWKAFFLTKHGVLSAFWGPLIGPLVSVISFVCSIGNVPLAAVLWNGGISFGGVISFIFADLIVIPILNIYRKYYSGRMAIFLFVTSYIAMILAGLIIEGIFKASGLVPAHHVAIVAEPEVRMNYTSVLNIVFLALASVLLWRAWRTGGFRMLAAMDGTPPDHWQGAGVAGEYSCSMHPEVRSAVPGRCPKCGMRLVLREDRPVSH